jgi:hypothetical protein
VLAELMLTQFLLTELVLTQLVLTQFMLAALVFEKPFFLLEPALTGGRLVIGSIREGVEGAAGSD